MWRVVLVSAVAVTAIESPAFARRFDREGFNFGATLHSNSHEDRTSGKIDRNEPDSKAETLLTTVTPYVGYAFSVFNLGVSLLAQNGSQEVVESLGDKQTIKNSTFSRQGLSLFGRFLFGRYFFFEGAGGLYRETGKTDVEVKEKKSTGIFAGTTDTFEQTTIGPGYNIGAGVEVPIAGGFFFTTAYQVRAVRLREASSGSPFGGRNRTFSQTREIAFGLSHYLN
jgi:hypothetical protein